MSNIITIFSPYIYKHDFILSGHLKHTARDRGLFHAFGYRSDMKTDWFPNKIGFCSTLTLPEWNDERISSGCLYWQAFSADFTPTVL